MGRWDDFEEEVIGKWGQSYDIFQRHAVSLPGSHLEDPARGSKWKEDASPAGVRTCPTLLQRARPAGARCPTPAYRDSAPQPVLVLLPSSPSSSPLSVRWADTSQGQRSSLSSSSCPPPPGTSPGPPSGGKRFFPTARKFFLRLTGSSRSPPGLKMTQVSRFHCFSYLLLRHNTQHPPVKGGKVYLVHSLHRFQSIISWL